MLPDSHGQGEKVNRSIDSNQLLKPCVIWAQFSSVQVAQSCPTLCRTKRQDTPGTPGFTVHQLSINCPSLSSNSWSLHSLMSHWWCHPTILSSAILFSSCLQSFPESGSFLMSQFFTSDGQSIGASASGSILPMNIQGWFSLELTGLFSLPSKGLSRVFSNTTVQKHLFFGTQLSLWSNSHIHTWLLEKP